MLWLLGEHLLLTAAPGVAVALFAARLGERRVPVLLALALAASGIAAALTFWAYYAAPLAGETLSYLVLFGSLLLGGFSLRGHRPDGALLRGLAAPLGLWALGSAFLVFLGFLHGGAADPLGMASTRFSGQLPPDNQIPLFFADWFFENGHEGTPPVFPGDWLSSDRPPLQVGYVLAQRPFGWGDGALHYQVLGVILQQLWIVGLWALLTASNVGRAARGLAVVAVLLSPVAIVNGFFVWPKLLPAAFLLAATALLATPLWRELRGEMRGGALIAVLFSLALLGHGASVFGIVPLIVLGLYRGRPAWRWIGVGVLVGALLLAPWAAYKRYGDPPGNRLAKWMLGGAAARDDRGTVETILDGYGEAGLGGTLDNKANNFEAITGVTAGLHRLDAAAGAALDGEAEEAVGEARELFFLELFPSLGLLLLAPLAMAVARARDGPRSAEWRLSLVCWAIVLLGSLVWGLLIFGGSQSNTSVHLGSMLIPVLSICAAVAGLWAVLPRFAPWYVGAWAGLVLALYVPALDPPPGSAYSALAALFAAAALAGFVTLALRAPVSEGPNRLAP